MVEIDYTHRNYEEARQRMWDVIKQVAKKHGFHASFGAGTFGDIDIRIMKSVWSSDSIVEVRKKLGNDNQQIVFRDVMSRDLDLAKELASEVENSSDFTVKIEVY